MSKIPSIAMIPSGYKANKVYSVLPTNGDGDLTFARVGEATRVNQLGLIETVATGVPRLDYSDSGCPSLLVEPQSTNLVTYSEDFSDVSWAVFDATKTPNAVISPDGTLNGCRITALSGDNKAFQVLQSVSADPNNDRTYTGSLYIKSPNATSCQLRVGSSGSSTTITISDEWQRFDTQYLLGATFTFIRLGVVLFNEGDIVDVALGQIEEQSYATSYIPTNGEVNGVTRSAETSSKTGLSSYINSSEGVLYLDLKTSENDTVQQIGLTDGTIDERILLEIRNGGTLLTYYVIQGGVAEAIIAIPIIAGVYNKVALSYKTNEAKIYVNGVLEGTDVVVTPPTGLDTISFNGSTGSLNVYISLKDLRVYNQALTDAELQALTKI